MKFPVNWLKQLISFDLTADALAEKLILAGFEVEDIIYPNKNLEKISTGKITKISKHPDANKLVITNIFDGQKNHQIVTGATNISVNDIVPVAYPGSVMENGMKIKKAKLRGIESNGMLCSESECGLTQTEDGIWILDPKTPIGIDFIEYADLKAPILDIAILPNRSDCLSLYGLAREIAHILNIPFKRPTLKIKTKPSKEKLKIKLESAKCPLYQARIINHIDTNKTTPIWLRRRLEQCDIRPIHLAIDITNYVLLEYGQPLHAFDKNKVKNTDITIRNAKEKESITTLDKFNRPLTTNDLVICFDNKAQALAGVMGGQESELSKKSTDIILESAYFEPATIRKTSQKFNLKSESSLRFERGTDPNTVNQAADRACQLYQELLNATISAPVFEEKNTKHTCFKEKTVPFNAKKINDYLGTKTPEKEQEKILLSLGFKIKKNTVIIPSWRLHDICSDACLAEEIARSIGFDQITEDTFLPPTKNKRSSYPLRIETYQDTFIHLGFNQYNTFPLISEKLFKNFSDKTPITIKNPLTPDQSILRDSLLPSLIDRVSFNLRRQQDNIKCFEIDSCFKKEAETLTEQTHLAGILTGHWQEQNNSINAQTNQKIDFFTVKGLIEYINEKHKLEITFKETNSYRFAHPFQTLDLYQNTQQIGLLGILHPEHQEKVHSKNKIAFFEINLSNLKPQKNTLKTKINPPTKYPHIRRDIALIAPKDLTYKTIQETIEKWQNNLVNQTTLFDTYESDKIGKENKSYTFSLLYQSKKETLSDEKINILHENLCQKLSQVLPIQIR